MESNKKSLIDGGVKVEEFNQMPFEIFLFNTTFCESTGKSVYHTKGVIIADGNIYPNPTTGILHISLPIGSNSRAADIMSLDGRLIKSFDLKGVDELKIDVSDLSNGAYFIKITTEQSQITKMFVKTE